MHFFRRASDTIFVCPCSLLLHTYLIERQTIICDTSGMCSIAQSMPFNQVKNVDEHANAYKFAQTPQIMAFCPIPYLGFCFSPRPHHNPFGDNWPMSYGESLLLFWHLQCPCAWPMSRLWLSKTALQRKNVPHLFLFNDCSIEINWKVQ